MRASNGLNVPGGQANGVNAPPGQYDPMGQVLLEMYTVFPILLIDPEEQEK